MQPYLGTSISIGSLKSAALYFDYIIPINLGAEFTDHGSFEKFPTELATLLRSLRELIPPKFRNDEVFAQKLAMVNKYTTELVLSTGRQQHKYDKLHDLQVKETQDCLYDLIDVFGLSEAHLDCRESIFGQEDGGKTSLTVIASLNLIEVEKVSWELILELRKDLEAQERLRRLGLFAYENYDRKPRSFVEDDILNRISEYEQEAKRWGLDLTHSTLNTVLGSKLLAGSFAGSFVSVFTGAPTVAVLGSLGVGSLELGRIAIEIVKRRTALVDLERRNPVSYISYAKKHLAKKPTGAHAPHRTHPRPW